jgi:hypothetical protein
MKLAESLRGEPQLAARDAVAGQQVSTLHVVQPRPNRGNEIEIPNAGFQLTPDMVDIHAHTPCHVDSDMGKL